MDSLKFNCFEVGGEANKENNKADEDKIKEV